jgi:amino acid adenylation domain-containing protein/non-ribosomal peptide synthase protein (TIGR01720 family)
MKLRNVEDIYPLAPMQEGILVHSISASGMYLLQQSCEIHGMLDVSGFRHAWQAILQRHTALRAAFFWHNLEVPMQAVRRWVELPWHDEDWRHLPKEEQEERWQAFLRHDRERGFDLQQAPLVRVTLVRINEEVSYLALIIHHIVIDGWCLSILTAEVLKYYRAYRDGCDPDLPPAPPYRQYIAWLQLLDKNKSENFWREELKGVTSPTQLGIELKNHNLADFEEPYGAIHSEWKGPFAETVRRLARSSHVTLNTVIQGAWAILLSIYSGECDVLFGASVSGRTAPIPGIANMVGVFTNTLPVRVQINNTVTAGEFLQSLQKRQAANREHEHTPLAKIQEWSDVPRGIQLFNSLIVFQNYPTIEGSSTSASDIDVRNWRTSIFNSYPVSLLVIPGKESILLTMKYLRTVFDDEAMRRLLGHLQAVTEWLGANPKERLQRISLLSETERRQILAEWNEVSKTCVTEKSLVELFEESVERNPDNTALVHEDSRLTYRELNRRANQLAFFLKRAGVGPEAIVGFYLERGIEAVIAILGILKAGGAYLPMDTEAPIERMKQMLDSSRVKVLLAHKAAETKLHGAEWRTIALDEEWSAITAENDDNPVKLHVPENAAYVIYTSGSTGKPKGIVVEHRHIANYVQGISTRLKLGAHRYASVSTLAADLGNTMLFPALVQGGELHIIAQPRLMDGNLLEEYFRAQQFDYLKIVPSHLEALRSGDRPREVLPRKMLIVGGEASQWRWIEEWSNSSEPCEIINHYGPSETTVGVLLYPIDRAEIKRKSTDTIVPVGRPFGNAKAYILNEAMEAAPIGVRGELYIGGAGVSRGYINDPCGTAERFLPAAFDSAGGERVYRTGDWARYRPDGNIEFLGRKDDQLKIRGYRVEPREIEAILASQEGVKQCAVIPHRTGSNSTKLVGYVVVEPGQRQDPQDLRSLLRQQLPNYMVPSDLVLLESLPLTANGKIDRRALSSIRFREATSNHAEPRNQVEATLARVWQTVLKLEHIGVHDNFFELGGDSILAIQVVTKARDAGIRLTPQNIFDLQTVAALAESLEPRRSAGSQEEEEKARHGFVPLTPIQERFFELELAKPDYYNQSVLLGLDSEVDLARLQKAILETIQYHDALQLQFQRTPQGWQQQYAGTIAETIYSICDLAEIPKEIQQIELERDADAVQSSLNLAAGDLVRAVVYDFGNHTRQLLLVIHHLLVDGVSWRILLSDIEVAYEQLRRNENISLGEKSSSYRKWSETIRGYSQGEQVEREVEYWSTLTRENVQPMPRDILGVPDEANTFENMGRVAGTLDESETTALLTNVPRTYHTQINDVLLAGLARAYGEWCGHESLLLDLEGHGREEQIAGLDVSRTVGWFTTIFPVLIKTFMEEASWMPGKALKFTKEELRKIPNRGFGYGLLRYLKDDTEIRAKLKAMPQAEIRFNYLGQLDQALGESKLFAPAQGNGGRTTANENHRLYLIDILATVVDKRLQISCRYNQKVHRSDTIKKLVHGYLECLRRIIGHSREENAGGYTPSDFPLAGLSQEQLDLWIGKGEGIQDIYRLSPIQEGILFHCQYEPTSGVYFIQFSCAITGKIDSHAFRRAWETLLQKHPVLRTSFLWDGEGHPIQIVWTRAQLELREEDWGGLSEEAQAAKWERLLRQDRERGFNLEQAPLLRLAIVRREEESYYCVWATHHIVIDGWCRQILMAEFLKLYKGYSKGQEPRLPPTHAYRDFIARLQSYDEEKAKKFWQDELRGFETPIRWSAMNERQVLESGEPYGEADHAPMDRAITTDITQMARYNRVTVNTVVQAGLAVLLQRYSGQNDIVFGATVSGRTADIPGIETMMGVLVNTLPVRVRVDDGETVGEFLRRLQEQQSKARQYEYSSLLRIQEWSGAPRGSSLFETLLVFENYPTNVTEEKEEAGAAIKIDEVRYLSRNNYPLTLIAVPGDQFHLWSIYDRRMFEQKAVGNMLQQLHTVLAWMGRQAERRVGEISLLTETERDQILVEWNRTAVNYPSEKCVHELFEEQAETIPEAIAVVYGSNHFTYARLNEAAYRLSAQLQAAGVGPDVAVGICMKRSPEMMAAVLGVLKASGAYVPMDYTYPEDRLSYMLENSGAKIVLSDSETERYVPPNAVRVICLEGIWEQHETLNVPKKTAFRNPDQLAYVIYTSGSTGRPKGVAMPHRPLVNLVAWQRESLELSARPRTLQFSSLSFDASANEAFTTWAMGGTLLLMTEELRRDAGALVDLLIKHRINTLFLPYAALHMIADQCELSGRYPVELRDVLSTAEPLQVTGSVANFFKQLPGCRLHNEYGPSETHVVTAYTVTGAVETWPVLPPIGRPIANTQTYIVDKDFNPAPAGVAGRLYIAGENLVRGYLGSVDLTAERFLPNPFTQSEGGRLYDTGDLAVSDSHGTIRFLGRRDQQIKIRGYRIEPGEIEGVLTEHAGVAQAVVVAHEHQNGDKQLVAYVVAKPEFGAVDTSELRSRLRSRLPEYMIPVLIVFLDALPMTPSGKIDRRALSVRENRGAGDGADSVPHDPVELQLMMIWEDLLKVPVGRNQNFFELGGHSLLALRLAKRVKDQFGQDLALSALFQNPTIELLARVLGTGDASSSTSHLLSLQPHGSKPPLYFVHALGGNALSYVPLARLLGADQPFFSFQALEEEVEREQILSIQERSQRYISALQETKAPGPYFLGGWSFGGFVAYEMARQLEEGHEGPIALVLFDIGSQTGRALQVLLDIADDANFLLAHLKGNEGRFSENSPGLAKVLHDASLENMEGKSAEERLQTLLKQLAKAGIVEEGLENSKVQKYIQGVRRRAQSILEYRLPPCKSDIILIRAAETKDDNISRGFEKLTTGSVCVHIVPGNHNSMLAEPTLGQLAATVSKVMAEAAGSNASRSLVRCG